MSPGIHLGHKIGLCSGDDGFILILPHLLLQFLQMARKQAGKAISGSPRKFKNTNVAYLILSFS